MPWERTDAVHAYRRMSLKDGGTKRRQLILRLSSWYRNASSSSSGVKKLPTDGTSIFNFERAAVPAF